MSQIPSNVLELYKNGGMSPEQMGEFEKLIQSGELTMPQAQPEPEPEMEMPQVPQKQFGESTTSGVYEEPQQQFTGEELQLSGFDTTPEEWPSQVNGKPVLAKKYWQGYQTRSLDHPTRMAVEQGIESGQYALPEGVDLNMVPKDRNLKEFLTDIFTKGGAYTIGKSAYSSMKGQNSSGLPGMFESKEAIEAGPGFWLSAGLADQKERADMFRNELGFKAEPDDFWGNPVSTAPDGKKHTVRSGLDEVDLAANTAIAVPSIIAGLVAAPVTASYGIWAGIGALGLSEMAIEAVVQTGQDHYGGDFSKTDVALAGALSVVPDAGVEIVKGYGRRELIKSAKDAIKGKNIAKFHQIYQENPKVIDTMMQGVDLKYDPATRKFTESIDFNQSMKTLARKADSKARQEAFARSLGLSEDAFKDFEQAGLKDSASLLEVADHRDSKTRQLVSSIKEEGSDSLESQKISRDIGLKDEFVSKMEKMGATKDKGALSKTIKDVMINDIKKVRASATPKYNRVGTASEGFSFNADETLAHLDDMSKKWAKRNEEGKVIKDASSPYTSFEKKVKNALTSTKVKGEKFAILDSYGNPIEIDSAEFEALSPLIRLKSLKEEAGRMMRDVNVLSTNEQRKASELYNMLKRDEERAIKALASEKGDPTLYDDWVDATNLWNDAKTKEKAMQDAFGNKIKDNLFSNVGKVKKELSETAIEEVEVMLDSLPKQYRSPYLKTALLDAMGSKPESMRLSQFGEWYEGFKDSSRGMMLLKKHLEPEEFKEFIGMGKVASRIRQAEGNLKGGDLDKIKDIVGAKKGLVKELAGNVGVYSGAGLVSGALVGLLPAGAGGVGIPLAILGAGKALKDHVGQKKFGKFLDVINSKEFLKLAGSQDNSQVYIKSLSKTETMQQFMKMIGKSENPSDIENFIKSSMQTGLQTERRSDKDNNNTGEK